MGDIAFNIERSVHVRQTDQVRFVHRLTRQHVPDKVDLKVHHLDPQHTDIFEANGHHPPSLAGDDQRVIRVQNADHEISDSKQSQRLQNAPYSRFPEESPRLSQDCLQSQIVAVTRNLIGLAGLVGWGNGHAFDIDFPLYQISNNRFLTVQSLFETKHDGGGLT